jgi:hypothetical protein
MLLSVGVTTARADDGKAPASSTRGGDAKTPAASTRGRDAKGPAASTRGRDAKAPPANANGDASTNANVNANVNANASTNASTNASGDPNTNANGTPDARDRSRAAFKRGVAQIKAQDWAGARASFELAWSLYQHPSILLNLGVARLRTGDPVLAEQALSRFLSDDSGSPPEEVAGAREALVEARSQIGTLKISVQPVSARVTIDGKRVEVLRPGDPSEGVFVEAREKAGKHEISASADGYAPERREVDLPGKGELDLRFSLARAEGAGGDGSGGPPTRTIAGWSLAGLAAVGLVTGTITGLRAASLSSDYSTLGSSRYGDPDTRSEGITFRTVTDVSFGVAILAGAAAAVLLFTDLGAAPPKTAARAHPLRLEWRGAGVGGRGERAVGARWAW